MPNTGLTVRLHRLFGPPVALLSSVLAVTCVVGVTDAARQAAALSVLEDRYVGLVGLAVLVCLAAGLVVLVAGHRGGAGPPVALGAAAGVFGLALGHDVESAPELALALVMLGVAVGCLVAGGACVAAEMSPALRSRSRDGALLGWALPLCAGWPVHAWLTLYVDPGGLRLTLHPDAWALGPVAVFLVGWAALSLLALEQRPPPPAEPGWESAWAALCVVSGGAGCLLMLVGFEPGLDPAWMRPVLLVVTGVVLGLLFVVGRAAPLAEVRFGALACGLVALTLPACVALWLAVADAAPSRWPWPALLVVVGCAVAGAAAGWLLGRTAVLGGLAVMALAAGAGWVMPASPWWAAAAVAPFLLGACAVFLAGLRTSAVGPEALRWTAGVTLVALLTGLVTAVPLGWALGGDVPVGEDDARAAGRALLGLTFALCVLALGYLSLLLPGSGRRSARGRDVSSLT